MVSFSRMASGGLLAGVLLAAVVAGVPARAAQTPQHPAAAPCLPAGHGAGVAPSLAFGRLGGNIRPMQVSIYGDGTIAYQGVTPAVPGYSIPPAAVLGLERLASAEGFWKMPASVRVPGVLPDVASQFITVRAGCSTTSKTVTVHGNAGGGFSELYATLAAATGLGISVTGAAPVPATTPAPSTSGGMAGPQAITLAQDGQTFTYALGQRFLLQLGTGYTWTLRFSDPAIFQRQINVAMIRGAQGIYVARTPGQTTLTATGVPLGTGTQPPAGAQSRSFTVQLISR